MAKLSELNYEHLKKSEWSEHVDRLKTWHSNPEKTEIRRAAKAAIKERIWEIVEPFGFKLNERGNGWEIKKRFKVRGIYVQPSRSGDRCFFNLSKRHSIKVLGVLDMKRDYRRLGTFYTEKNNRVGEPGSLYYYDVEQFPDYVNEVMGVLARKAVPWLLT